MRLSFWVFAALLLNTPAWADLPMGKRAIVLSNGEENIEIGTVTFDGSGPKRKISIKFDDTPFKDEFLSMRPFKCLEGKTRYYCHVPYPYEWKGEISETDLTDLEYAMLFVQKKPSAYGIDLSNGIYFKLGHDTSGEISGALNEFDMEVLATPPEAGNLRPVTLDLLTEAISEEQWLPSLSFK